MVSPFPFGYKSTHYGGYGGQSYAELSANGEESYGINGELYPRYQLKEDGTELISNGYQEPIPFSYDTISRLLTEQKRESIRTLMLAIAVAILAILRLRERRG